MDSNIINRIPTKFKRKRISLDKKLNILERIENGEKVPFIAKELNMSEATIRTIRKNESKIRHWIAAGSSMSIHRVAFARNILMARMENCLSIWIEDCNQKDITINYSIIKQKALKIFTHLRSIESPDPNLSPAAIRPIEFAASKGWFDRYKKRFSLHNMKFQEEQASADIEAATKFPKEFMKIIEEGGYTADQVFNADETSLYWKKMPQRTYIDKNEKCASGFKASKDRITIILCSNASGDYITKPMLINRALNPRAMKGIDKSDLPVHWRSNKKAWMTGILFRDWFYNCFVPEAENYTCRKNIAFKILLIIDNASSHHQDLNHPNIRIIYTPPNTTSIVQPLNQGIIKIFKSYYVRETFQLIAEILDAVSNKTLTELWKDFSILNCIEIVETCIKEFEPTTLNTCWKCIWPEVVFKESRVSATDAYERIINIAQSLGGDGFEDINEYDINELINHDPELSEEELVQLADESDPNGKSAINETLCDVFVEPAPGFCLDTLSETLQMANNIERYFTSNDPITERSDKFKRQLRNCLAPYVSIQKELQNKMEVSMITDTKQEYISPKIEICEIKMSEVSYWNHDKLQ